MRLTHDRRVWLMALGAGLPGTAIALILLWRGDFSSKVQWTLTLFIVGLWWGVSVALRDRVVYPLQTLSNLLAALREEDFSIRARGQRRDDPLGEVLIEMNALADTLREQRLGALEATSLLRAVMEEIPVAVFAFDPERRLRVVNRAGERLLARPSERLLGQDGRRTGAGAVPRDRADRPARASTFPGGTGRWEVRTGHFRQGGIPLELLVMTDVSRSLRDEERQAWQRLIRVIGHEINNSLAPIKSIAHSLERLVARDPRAGRLGQRHARRPAGDRQPRRLARPLHGGLRAARPAAGAEHRAGRAAGAAGAGRGTRTAPARPPERRPAGNRAGRRRTDRTAASSTWCATPPTPPSPPAEASPWLGRQRRRACACGSTTRGPGVSNPANLFVPFFTTKPGGSGIGLVLCRQIAEAHGGTVTLENRNPGPGCRAELVLPLD